MKTEHQLKVSEFLQVAAQFQLGGLATEASNPRTIQLSKLAQSDMLSAVQIFQEVEVDAFKVLIQHSDQLNELSSAIVSCLSSQGRVFFCGCGATGRLSISLETNWRESLFGVSSTLRESVFGFIAGGDYALVKSIENFEDHPEYGARQLVELGFSKNDLLISCTEGGETPFVIGATLKAAEISERKSYFLFCNSKKQLKHIDRSQSVFTNPKIHSWSFECGPQAICGSTRLQASSLLYFACGSALFSAQAEVLGLNAPAPLHSLTHYIEFLKNVDLSSLINLINLESQTYASDQYLTYHLTENPMPILTDLTERSPTFNLLALENEFENSIKAATMNFCVDSANHSDQAWEFILGRRPRALNWPELNENFNSKVLLGFDFSKSKTRIRNKLIANKTQQRIQINFQNSSLNFINAANDFEICKLHIPSSILARSLFLKLVFNLVSTLSQCKNGRVLGNIMLFVKPSNKKLIDRSARFAHIILRDQYQISSQYEDLIDCVFMASEDLKPEESVVLKSVEFFLKHHRPKL